MKISIGYHGTNASVVTSIENDGYLLSSKTEWFGAGVYFFEDSLPLTNGFEEAKYWALNVKKFENWAVFRAEISSDNYFNLVNNQKDKDYFNRISTDLFELHIRAGKRIIEFDERVVFKSIEKENVYDYIKAPVNAAKNKGYFRYLNLKLQIQLCVKNTKVIAKNECVKNSIKKGFKKSGKDKQD